jgi:hypothetical protein
MYKAVADDLLRYGAAIPADEPAEATTHTS